MYPASVPVGLTNISRPFLPNGRALAVLRVVAMMVGVVPVVPAKERCGAARRLSARGQRGEAMRSTPGKLK